MFSLVAQPEIAGDWVVRGKQNHGNNEIFTCMNSCIMTDMANGMFFPGSAELNGSVLVRPRYLSSRKRGTDSQHLSRPLGIP